MSLSSPRKPHPPSERAKRPKQCGSTQGEELAARAAGSTFRLAGSVANLYIEVLCNLTCEGSTRKLRDNCTCSVAYRDHGSVLRPRIIA